MPRPRLRTLQLTGPRSIIHRISFTAVTAAATIAGIGYVLPAHRAVYVAPDGWWSGQEAEASFHSSFADGGPISLVILAFVAVTAILLRRLKLGAGVLAGAIGAAGAFASILPVVLVHMFSKQEHAYGEHVFAIGIVGLFFIGIATCIAEPILYVLERRHLEQAARPAPLPAAVAICR